MLKFSGGRDILVQVIYGQRDTCELLHRELQVARVRLDPLLLGVLEIYNNTISI